MKISTVCAITAALFVGAVSTAIAQDRAAPAASADAPHNAAIKSPNDGGPGPLAAGQNSFTEDQARDRIQKAGYSQLTDLTKSDDGLWQGHAMKHGHSVAVSMDFRGHITSR
jgi:hypothetical protein